MAKYFLDTEFIEGFKKPFFGKRRHFIDLISIGIVCEDGRTYSAISNEYKYKDADEWVKENVIIPLYSATCSGDAKNRFTAENFHYYFGKSNKQIAKEVIDFCRASKITDELIGYSNTEFYGYYSDYDWVLFCSLFGRMIDLPTGFPMYMIDLKQTLDEKAINLIEQGVGTHTEGNKWRADNFDEAMNYLKKLNAYPKQLNEHNSLFDATWNFDLYNFLKSL